MLHFLSRCTLVLSLLTSLIFHISLVKADPISEEVTLSDQLDITVIKYPSKADTQQLILWLAPSFGFKQGHYDMSQTLNHSGFEVWMADINDALFLPHTSTAMRELDAKYVADLIEYAHTETGKQIVLMSGSYGAIPVLRGARQWLLRQPKSRYLLGAILFSPNIYQQIPPLGVDPDYLPIVYATSIPIVIFQGSLNNNRWQLDRLISGLRQGGSFVHVELIPDTVGLFYGDHRPPHIDKFFGDFATNMKNQIKLFQANPYLINAKNIHSVKLTAGSGLDSQIKPFKGNPKPLSLSLKDINGVSFNINDFRNRVVLVNFWATWCSPCIKEIPSLNKLREKMRDKPFQLISINYAESPETIKQFMKMVSVEFPVLVDEQGHEAARWKVIVFPSTFVIGMDGLIHYGVNAGIEWDTPDVIETINQLMAKKR